MGTIMRNEGGTDVGRKLLQHSFVEHDMSQLFGRSRLDALEKFNSEELAVFIADESVQTQALILAHIDARKSFETLEVLSGKIRSQVLLCIAKLEPIDASALDNLNLKLK